MVRERRRRNASARFRRSKQLVVLRRYSRPVRNTRPKRISRLGFYPWAATGANHTASIPESPGLVLGSVSAPKLVFPPVASWVPAGAGSANPCSGGESRRSFGLGFAVLELFRA